jgi:PTS system cellobiose-specific IIA component
MEVIQADQIIMGLIIHAGDAKSHIYLALDYAKKADLVASEEEIRLAETALNEAHNIQSSWLAQEARGEGAGLTALFVHAQDHLMTTITEINLIKEVIETRQELAELKKLITAN